MLLFNLFNNIIMTTTEIPTELIEKALALTGKTMEDIEEKVNKIWWTMYKKFCIEKFCYYLLSPSFIEKYSNEVTPSTMYMTPLCEMMWRIIHAYQKGNSEPLIELLQKI